MSFTHPVAIVLYVIVALVLLISILVAFKPQEFRVSRSIEIDSAPASVFAVVNDLKRWQAWSPWAKLDPNAKETYEGSGQGVGSSFAWDGDRKVGSGKMTIRESQLNQRIGMQLEFIRPFACKNDVEFVLQPVSHGTRLTWTMVGPNSLFAKIMSLCINMEKMVGKDFEQGLKNLKNLVEAA